MRRREEDAEIKAAQVKRTSRFPTVILHERRAMAVSIRLRPVDDPRRTHLRIDRNLVGQRLSRWDTALGDTWGSIKVALQITESNESAWEKRRKRIDFGESETTAHRLVKVHAVVMQSSNFVWKSVVGMYAHGIVVVDDQRRRRPALIVSSESRAV